MNVEQRHVAADPQTKPPDLGCWGASGDVNKYCVTPNGVWYGIVDVDVKRNTEMKTHFTSMLLFAVSPVEKIPTSFNPNPI